MPIKANALNQSSTPIIERSINKDLTIILVLIVFLISMITICANYFYISYQEKKRLGELADEYLAFLNQTVEPPIWTLDIDNVVKIADSFFNNELIDTLQIVEKNYESPEKFSEKSLFNKKKSDDSDLVVRESRIRHGGNIIGNIRIGLTQKLLNENLQRVLMSSVITMLLSLLTLTLMTSILLRLFMKKPLDILMHGINQISKGNYDYPFQPVKQREFHSILLNFIYMANQIQRREKSLADVNHQLEVQVVQKKKAEDEMRKREAQLRSIFEASADGILVTSDNGFIINANDYFYSMWKIPDTIKNQYQESLLSKFMMEQIKLQDIRKFKAEKMHQTSPNSLDEIYLKDGRTFERFSCPLILEGISIGRVWNFRDVTDRKRSLQALRESEARFRQLSEAALEAIVVHDNGIILQANDQFLKMFSYLRKEVIGKLQFIKCISPEYHDLIDPKNYAHQLSFLEVEGLKKNETKFPIVIRNREMIYYGKNVVVSIIRDISDRKSAELETQSLKEKLARSKKMEVLGLLAGGVAHDLNNILSGIVSYPELLLMKEGLDENTRKALKTIQESGERAAAVVNDLTTISRGVAIHKEALNINSIIQEYLSSPEFQRLKILCPDVEIKTQLEPELFNIYGSRLHIRKCLMNLITNASEAIEKEGEIVISTNNCYLDKPLKAYTDIEIGEYALLTVYDNGSGISKEAIDRIFEPFYTKKMMGRSGTGLGLTVVWNTLIDHSGYINVTSGSDGTKFDLYFPISRESINETVDKFSIDEIMGHGEKILIVDDEQNQREIAKQMLTSLGYIAETISNGEQAIEYLKSNPVDLIVLDMIMPPGINGFETYQAIVNGCPGQKAIIASGFSVTEDVKAAQELGAGWFLKKPYNLEKLGMAVKQELQRGI